MKKHDLLTLVSYYKIRTKLPSTSFFFELCCTAAYVISLKFQARFVISSIKNFLSKEFSLHPIIFQSNYFSCYFPKHVLIYFILLTQSITEYQNRHYSLLHSVSYLLYPSLFCIISNTGFTDHIYFNLSRIL